MGFVIQFCRADDSSDIFVITNFDRGNQNFLGGYFNKFEREPSKSLVTPSETVFRGKSGKSLEIFAQKQDRGFCGGWLHLFDFKDESPQFFNAMPYEYLSFWVKGEKGGEKFTIRMADAGGIAKDDTVSLGKIDQFLPDGVTQEWQEVLVPLSKAKTLDLTQLGGLSWEFGWTGDTRVYIDDVSFKKSKEVILPESPGLTSRELKLLAAKQAKAPPRTLWVWYVYRLLKNENGEQAELFELCARENVGRLWLQIPSKHEPGIDFSIPPESIQPESFKVSLSYETELRAFIRAARAKGIKIEALDGYPEYAQKPYHFVPLAIVDCIIDFNKRVEPEERFDGVHFDNEPYLIIGWHDAARREQILAEFTELNLECQRRIREQSDMVYGIDVPFWWNKIDPETGEAIGVVTYQGERKAAVFFAIDHLDNLGIMDYRDAAYGADGIISNGQPILAYASKAKKCDIYVGLEVFQYEPTVVWFPLGLPRAKFLEALRGDAKNLSYLSRINGFRTQTLDDGSNLHVGIELPANPDAATQDKARATVSEIARYLGVDAYPSMKDREAAIVRAARNGVQTNLEWKNFEDAEIIDPQTNAIYPGFKATSIMLSKTTFADESYEVFEQQVKFAEAELIGYPVYSGIAIHFYDVLLKKSNTK